MSIGKINLEDIRNRKKTKNQKPFDIGVVQGDVSVNVSNYDEGCTATITFNNRPKEEILEYLEKLNINSSIIELVKSL